MYIKTEWKDQDVENPRTYVMQNNADGSVTLLDKFGTIVDLGTPVNAENMNKIEEGVFNSADKDLSNLSSTGEDKFANKDLSNINPLVQRVVAEYSNSSGDWYVIFERPQADGSVKYWCEQGFIQATGTAGTINANLLIPSSLQSVTITDGASARPSIWSVYAFRPLYTTQTYVQFYVQTADTGNVIFKVCGYCAKP